ncbi:hypothetical protein BFP72_12130 [Reichenbachiella sp. 5M10]|uniref:T9SS type A sorting domain-containing protein n=1 Tax=Reichenbachiella sp. 5M10 TaxID=1889772 RepID=UPI000C453850|nr:T9SS type A sorting domain-containing protein [Reichenbachiella sp. 5M10]PIB36088.1 hypothetical protein BFP72_12130 [Reichenbachiella sp. 5M10]
MILVLMLFWAQGASAQVDLYGPGTFEEIMSRAYAKAWVPTAVDGLSNLDYTILLDAETKTKALSISQENIGALEIVPVSSLHEIGATYASVLSGVFQWVDVATSIEESWTGEYQIRPVLHSYFALTSPDGVSLETMDVSSYYLDQGESSYLRFEAIGDAHSMEIKVSGRWRYQEVTATFEEDTSWEVHWLSIGEDVLELVPDQADASRFFLANAHDLIDFSLLEGSDFNPKNTAWQESPFADYPEDVWGYEESALYSDHFFKDIDEAYHAQLSDTEAADQAVSKALDDIEETLAAAGEQMRYDRSVYLTFRDNLMARRFMSDDIYNSRLGEKTVAYVYFTNARDDNGAPHPFMVIASHNASDGPNFLIDVARPPGAGDEGGYAEQSITRNAVLEVKLVKIPLRDYGLVDDLTDNDFSAYGTLASDLNLPISDYDVYNYASVASNGIAIDGVVIYPSYNNNLRFAALDAEITSTGIHVGRGMGLHYHADGHGYNQNGINLYNTEDFAGKNHPPMIGFAYDGLALFGRYEQSHTAMLGYDVSLDEFGGHAHGDLGYHYHAFGQEVTFTDEMGSTGPFVQHFLLVGAWKGNINAIPGIMEGSTAQLKETDVGRYAGASYEESEEEPGEEPEEPQEVLGTSSQADEEIVLYPNPALGEFVVKAEHVDCAELYDLNGRVLMIASMENGVARFDVTGLAQGVYVLKLHKVSGVVVKRVSVR